LSAGVRIRFGAPVGAGLGLTREHVFDEIHRRPL
jgi:hypothetical protein